MKLKDRDDLLIRIDERTYTLVKNQDEIFGRIKTVEDKVVTNATDIRWIKRVGGGVSAALAGLIAAFKGGV